MIVFIAHFYHALLIDLLIKRLFSCDVCVCLCSVYVVCLHVWLYVKCGMYLWFGMSYVSVCRNVFCVCICIYVVCVCSVYVVRIHVWLYVMCGMHMWFVYVLCLYVYECVCVYVYVCMRCVYFYNFSLKFKHYLHPEAVFVPGIELMTFNAGSFQGKLHK